MSEAEADALRRVTRLASVLLAPNPGPMTLDGTNTYRLAAPDRPGDAGWDGAIVVDPGPDDVGHLGRIVAAGPVALVLITHRHDDHTAGAARLHALTAAPVRAADPRQCIGAAPLVDGEVIRAGELEVRVLTTPGHTDDSVCLFLPDDAPAGPAEPTVTNAPTGPAAPTEPAGPAAPTGQAGKPASSSPSAAGSVLTGDSVLGRGTAVIASPDGALGPYLDSLRRLAALGGAHVLPGHGPDLPDLAAVCHAYLQHRAGRLAEVRAALARLASTDPVTAVPQVTDIVYGDVDPRLRSAAEQSVAAQLRYLAAE